MPREPRRSDPEKRKSVRKRAADKRDEGYFTDSAIIPLLPFEMLSPREQDRRIKEGGKTVRGPIRKMREAYAKGGAVRKKYAKGGAVRGPNS